MPSALGIPGLIPIGGGGGVQLYTTIVTTSAELITALTTDGGDTFIVAGTYTVDMGTIGALDTTPRRFLGAAQSEVVINLEDTVGGNSGPDFSASLTDAAGVGFENCTFVNTGANGLLSLLTGCYGVYNCFFDTNNLAVIGLSTATNVVNVSVDMNTTPSPFGTGFSFCNRLSNCAVIRAQSVGYSLCEDLVNCKVVYQAGTAVVGFHSGFATCVRLSNCEADFSVTVLATNAINGFGSCDELSSCVVIGPTGGGINNLTGFSVCRRMTACSVQDCDTNFGVCTQMSGCSSLRATATGYDGCQDMAACRSSNDSSPFFACSQLSACLAASSISGTAGFDNCVRMSACDADTSSGEGFLGCLDMAGCLALSNALDGFSSCQNISSGRTSGNTGFGYASNDRVSCALGSGDVAGLSDGFNTAVDPVTAAGI